MKKTFITLLLLLGFFTSHGQPNITNLSYPSSVGLFDLYEISFLMGNYRNPYDPDTISVYAIFTSPNNRCDTVLGFYYEGYTFRQDPTEGYEIAVQADDSDAIGWRIRYTPDTIGTWNFRIHAEDQGGVINLPAVFPSSLSFTCQSVTNANGFIKKANSKYLKRDVVENGQRKNRSFYPVGPNIAWYSILDYGTWEKPLGIYEYERRIDSLEGNCNYMRIWINRYQFLNLYGPEYTYPPTIYFDSLINQKDSAELDHIVEYAAQHNISLMMCFFSMTEFFSINTSEPDDPTIWVNNPYNTIIRNPNQFFSDPWAARVTRNLFRYIVARWGYATNLMCWELWNEVDQLYQQINPNEPSVEAWHNEMKNYIKSIDPFKHVVTTSMGGSDSHPELYNKIFKEMDIVQLHPYSNIEYAESRQQTQFNLLLYGQLMNTTYPSIPYFYGESGFSPVTVLSEKDTCGIDLHNALWSSLFSASIGPTSFWWWYYVDQFHLYNRFKPMLEFCKRLPKLSDSFSPNTTAQVRYPFLDCENGINTYYMKNASEDTIYGWSQDTAFSYQSLRRLTEGVQIVIRRDTIFNDDTIFDPNTNSFIIIRDTIIRGLPHWMFNNIVTDPYGYLYTLDILKRPQPCSNSNIIKIPIENRPVGSTYEVIWYNSETGLSYNYNTIVGVQQDAQGNKYIPISFPSNIRNISTHTMNNTFGDVVFALIYREGDPGVDNKKTTN